MRPPVLRQVLGQPTLCPPQGLLTSSTSLDSGTQGRPLPSCSVLLSPSVTWNHHFLAILLLFALSCPAFPSPSPKWHLELMWGCYLEPKISKVYDPPKKEEIVFGKCWLHTLQRVLHFTKGRQMGNPGWMTLAGLGLHRCLMHDCLPCDLTPFNTQRCFSFDLQSSKFLMQNKHRSRSSTKNK